MANTYDNVNKQAKAKQQDNTTKQDSASKTGQIRKKRDQAPRKGRKRSVCHDRRIYVESNRDTIGHVSTSIRYEPRWIPFKEQPPQIR